MQAQAAPATASIPEYIAAAVADSNRPDADRERDVNRKPADVIAFAGLKPGDKIADFIPGRGYFTKIFCKIVGDSGRVYAISLPRVAAPATGASSSSSSAAPAIAPACNNVTSIRLQGINRPAPELHSSSDDPGYVYEYWSSRPAAESFATPEALDMIWTSENYHDLHNKGFGEPDMLLVNRALLAALKPGGILMIEDHAAAPKSGARDTDTLHRIDPEQVKKEVTAAGFEFVGESKVLRSKDDPHTAKAHEMHDKTDRFLFKFRKP
jgi:predicted methyltransferase